MRRECGITLLEAVMLIAVIGILTAMSIPRIGYVSRQSARSTARQIIADMRYARRLAITTAKDHIVRFSPSGGAHTEYSILRLEDETEVLVGRIKQIKEGVTCDGPDEFTFYPIGSASSNGTISLSAEGDQFDVNVIAATGRVY